jgi:hypothetical protein
VTPAPIPTPVQAFAPEFALGLARRVGLIVAGLAAVVAHRFLKDPRFASLIIPLWTRLNRAAGRFQRLMTRIAANRLAKPGPSRAHRPRPETARPPALPAGHAWLIRALGYEAAAYACQLEYLLSEPGVAEFLAAYPAAGRILRPLGRMLGLNSPALRPTTPKPRAKRRGAPAEPPSAEPLPAAPPPAPVVPLPAGHPCATYRPSAHWPAACRRRAHPA